MRFGCGLHGLIKLATRGVNEPSRARAWLSSARTRLFLRELGSGSARFELLVIKLGSGSLKNTEARLGSGSARLLLSKPSEPRLGLDSLTDA